MKIKKLLFISKDPGGVNSILPVIKKCKKESDKYECIVISHQLTEYRYLEENIATIGLEEFNYNSNKKKAVSNVLNVYQPDIIITGSSRPYDYEPITPEQLFIEIAKEKKIISISILDYWGKYLERFSSFDGEFNLSFVPDKICALDQISMKSLLSLGIIKDDIKITHNPNFDQIVSATVNSKSRLVSDKPEFNVLFISQPLIESKDKYNQGYSQIDMFNNFLIFLSLWKPHASKHVQVWLHPKEDKNKWNKMISEASSECIRIDISEQRDNDIFEWSDFLVSGFSTLMYQALYYLLPVISMQIGLNKKDQLITNGLDLSIPLYTKDEMDVFSKSFDISLHSRMLEKQKNKLTSENIFFSDGLATQRIVHLINNMNTGE
tara:strand:- start:831 stop:1967 length:1137 start_codon:yes stop_codon:yes gene_type:complete